AYHDDVRHDALLLERPEVRADAPQAGLHLVGDAHAAYRADMPIDRIEIAGRRHDLSADARTGLRDERSQADIILAQPVDDVAHGQRVELSRLGIIAITEPHA